MPFGMTHISSCEPAMCRAPMLNEGRHQYDVILHHAACLSPFVAFRWGMPPRIYKVLPMQTGPVQATLVAS